MYDYISASGKGKRLLLFMDMINQTVGDSLSDMLMVEAILHAKGWDVPEWSRAYQVRRMNFIILFDPIFIATKIIFGKLFVSILSS